VINKYPLLLNLEDDPKTLMMLCFLEILLFCKEAINDEMDSIIFNNTWPLVDLPIGSKLIRCKWVFRKKKYHSNGSIQAFKTRLMAEGYKEKE